MHGHRRSRAARTTLLWGLAVFALLQLGLAGWIEWKLPQFRDPSYAVRAAHLHRRLERERTRDGARPKLVVMTGSSRTLHALRGVQVEAELSRKLGHPVIVYNLGVLGAPPSIQLLNFARLLLDGLRPDLALLEVLPAHLNDGYRAGDRWAAVEQLDYRDLDLIQRYGLPGDEQLRRAWQRAWPVPWFTHRANLVGQAIFRVKGYTALSWQHSCDNSGWLPGRDHPITPAERRYAQEDARKQFVRTLPTMRIGGSEVRALRRLAQECRREHIPAALVLMPEGPLFRSWYPPAVWQQVEKFLDDLSAEQQTPLVNAREWLEEDDFSDSHHVLLGGAQRFSKRLAREVILPTLQGAGTPRRPGTPALEVQHRIDGDSE